MSIGNPVITGMSFIIILSKVCQDLCCHWIKKVTWYRQWNIVRKAQSLSIVLLFNTFGCIFSIDCCFYKGIFRHIFEVFSQLSFNHRNILFTVVLYWYLKHHGVSPNSSKRTGGNVKRHGSVTLQGPGENAELHTLYIHFLTK